MSLLYTIRRAALGDPFAEWYSNAAQAAFVLIMAVVVLLVAIAVLVYFPDPGELANPSPDPSPPPGWSTNPYFVKAVVGLLGIGIVSLALRVGQAIRTKSPHPQWKLFPSLWTESQRREAAALSAAATFLGLGLWAAGLITLAVIATPQWVVGGVALILVWITVWGPIVVGLKYYEDLCTIGRAEVALELKEQAAGLEEALRVAVAQFETVRTELQRLESEADRSRQAAAVSQELAKAHQVIERHGRWRSRREQLVFAVLGVILGAVLAIILDVNGLRERLPDWMVMFS
jgi:hypothetical protein